MTVRELIEKLEELENKELTVLYSDWDTEYGYQKLEVQGFLFDTSGNILLY